jgi:hypothetical protein
MKHPHNPAKTRASQPDSSRFSNLVQRVQMGVLSPITGGWGKKPVFAGESRPKQLRDIPGYRLSAW